MATIFSSQASKFGVETLGPSRPSAHCLFKELVKRLVDTSRDSRAGFYIGQRLSVAIQGGNAASFLDTLPVDRVWEEFYGYVPFRQFPVSPVKQKTCETSNTCGFSPVF